SVGVDRAILIPPSWEGHYNDLALDAVNSFPDRFAVMGRIFLEHPMNDDQFMLWRQQQGILGVRCIFHSQNYQRMLLNGNFDWLWPLAERHSVPLSVMMPRMENAADVIKTLLRKYPDLKITLDHLNIHSAGKSHIAQQVKQFSALAGFPNFAIKASAVPRWSQEPYPFYDTHDYLKRLFDTFGPQRMFWGSDFTRLEVNYRSAVCQFIEEIDWMDCSSLQWVMGRGICEWLGWPMLVSPDG
ncbi:MAG: amidohydrolase family protein, partial [Pseudomonadota bacterium]|nr:amidohydrolase family protein [Pseudomonadota bacterium]